jgi:hypothetical protein
MSRERELLEELSTKDMVSYYYPNLIDRIKELLAQPEREPVAWMWANRVLGGVYYSNIENPNWTPLYTSPRREPLSVEESLEAAIKLYEAEDGLGYAEGFVDGLKYAEKVHGIGEQNEKV